jgi:hypothetical protein
MGGRGGRGGGGRGGKGVQGVYPAGKRLEQSRGVHV